MKTNIISKIYIYFITTFLAIFFISCEDPIQVELEQGKQLLVIDAFVNNLRQEQKIRITLSQNYFDNGTAVTVVPDAQVLLKDITTNTTYTFNYTTNGYYTYTLSPTDTIAKVNHWYQLEVTYKGYKYTATAQQKRSAIIDSIQVKYDKNVFSGKEGYKCILWGRDIVGPIPDFYWIKSFRNSKFFEKPVRSILPTMEQVVEVVVELEPMAIFLLLISPKPLRHLASIFKNTIRAE